MDAKQGLLSSARRHARLGLALLAEHPNAWLVALAELIEVAIAIMRVDIPEGIRHADRSVEFAVRSGAAQTIGSARGNLANLEYLAGHYDRALELFDAYLPDFVPYRESYVGTLDALGYVRLSQNRLDECGVLLDQIVAVTAPS